jgi:hypothetical protein
MDCDAFRDNEIDALYGELDPSVSAAMDQHAAGCAECAARMKRLRATRSLLPALMEPVPDSLEARILSAAESVKPKTAQAAPPGGAKIFRFLSAPVLAAAAGLILVIGAATLFGGAAMMKSASRPASVVAEPSPMASATVAATADQPQATPPSAPAVAAAGETAASASPSSDPQLASAKAAYASGKFGEACPKFDLLAANDPEADLYAARCVQRKQGCMAAAPRFDATAQRNAGTETGSRAALEAARCYRAMSDARAKLRYAALENDPYVGDEAQNDQQPAVASRKAAAPPPPAATAAPAQAGQASKPPMARPATRPAKPVQAAPPAADALQ